MIDFSKYFIVGTNSDALHDTMNGIVTGEIIRCKDCHWYIESEVFKGKDCTHFSGLTYPNPDDYCSYAERKEE